MLSFRRQKLFGDRGGPENIGVKGEQRVHGLRRYRGGANEAASRSHDRSSESSWKDLELIAGDADVNDYPEDMRLNTATKDTRRLLPSTPQLMTTRVNTTASLDMKKKGIYGKVHREEVSTRSPSSGTLYDS